VYGTRYWQWGSSPPNHERGNIALTITEESSMVLTARAPTTPRGQSTELKQLLGINVLNSNSYVHTSGHMSFQFQTITQARTL